MSEDNTQAVNTSVESQVTTPTDSAPVENNTPEVTQDESTHDSGSAVEESQTGDTSEVQDDGASQTDESGDDQEPLSRAEKRNQQLNEQIRERVALKKQLDLEIARANSQFYQPASVDALLEQVNPETGDYYTPLEAKFAVMEQERSIEKYNAQISESRFTLATETQEVLSDFPLFDASSKDYNPQLAAAADQILASNLIYDPNTNEPIGSRTSVYQIYKTVADAYNAGSSRGEVQGQRATSQMLANADLTASAPQREVPFEKMTLNQKRAYLKRKGHDIK